MIAIETRMLSKHYGRRMGVEKLSLSVSEGSLFGFLGPNGSGKTTTIRVLMGLLRESGGHATIHELDCWRDARRIKHFVGYLPGELRLYPWLTCRLGLRIGSAARGVDVTQFGLELADEFALDPVLPARKMSRGTRQKLGLILALAHQPSVLILDEPTSGLDPIMQERLFARLRDFARQGRTVLFSSHTLSEVEELCDRVAVLREGRLVADETLASLRRRASRRVVIRWATPRDAEIAPPTGLVDIERNGDTWNAVLSGDAAELVRWCAARPIADISIEPPNLTALFMDCYRRGANEL